MRIFQRLFGAVFLLLITACSPDEGEGPPAADILDFDEVAVLFFEAYKAGDRKAALEVADPVAVDKLSWDASAVDNPTMTLDLESSTIVYEGGRINLIIMGDGHVGANVVDVELMAD